MTSGMDDSFITNNDSIIIVHQECDSNFPTTIEVRPHKSVKFFGKLRSRIRDSIPAIPRTFKLGLVDLPYNLFLTVYSSKDKRNHKIF